MYHTQTIFLEKEIKNKFDLAIAEANILVFMVDVTTGITDLDESLAQELCKSRKNGRSCYA
ncbi:MAG: hypothetical protein IPF58_16435 [Saprospirales bacterium]|nr:hypothetical protein [Saprospirales bacterium]